MKQTKYKAKHICCQVTAIILALLLLLPVTAFGAEGQNDGTVPVSYDESLYVTLDHYGNRKQLSLVKGVDLNGNKSFTDYGSYANVQNMSGYEKPDLTADGAVWNLGDYQKNRLYFEATPKDQDEVTLPWNFKISYKLNGVPTKAEDLAGKSGTVEMIAECAANPAANDYMKNNMLLQLVTLVDTEHILSVEAEGAQTQALGKYKAVIFAALPGESTTFRIRIGSEKFSSLGLIMMIEPATLAQMEQLKELREAKDTIGDAPAVLLNGTGNMLQSVGGMADSMGQVGQGLNNLKDAYANMQDFSGDITAASGEMISAFSEMSSSLSGLMPYIGSASRQLTKIKEILESLLGGLPTDPGQMTGEQLKQALADMDEQMEQARPKMAELRSEVNKLNTLAEAMEEDTAGLPEFTEQGASFRASVSQMQETVETLNTSLDQTVQQRASIDEILAGLGQLSELITDPELIAEVKALGDTLSSALAQAGPVGEQLVRIASSGASILGALTNAVSASASDLNTGIGKVLNGLSDATGSVEGLSETSSQLQGVGSTLQGAIDKVLNKFTQGNNFLNIDTNAQKQSITSEKNGAPSSQQMVLRTETIGLELMNESDETQNQVAQTPWARIEQVFEKIWRAIKTLFE